LEFQNLFKEVILLSMLVLCSEITQRVLLFTNVAVTSETAKAVSILFIILSSYATSALFIFYAVLPFMLQASLMPMIY